MKYCFSVLRSIRECMSQQGTQLELLNTCMNEPKQRLDPPYCAK